MPPRKRQKVAPKSVDAIVSGVETSAVPMSLDAVPNLMKSALAIVDVMYALRHSTDTTIHLAEIGPLSPKDGLFTWPIGSGGTFKQIAQRAWSNPERFLDMSCELAVKTGFTDATESLEFVQQYCKLEARIFSRIDENIACFLLKKHNNNNIIS